MRFRQIILEYDRQKTFDRLGDRLRDRVNKLTLDIAPDSKPVSDETLDQIIRAFEAADPTAKKAYTVQLIEWFLDGSMAYVEDASKATDGLILYAKFKNRKLPPLSSFSFSQFLDYADDHLGVIQSQTDVGKAEEQAFFERGDAVLERDTPGYKVIVPHTEAASCHFGRGTRWCTAADRNNQFLNYQRVGKLFIVLFKGQTKKWQLCIQARQFMNSRDESIRLEDWFEEKDFVEWFSKEHLRHWLGKYPDLLGYYPNPDSLPETMKIKLLRNPFNVEYFKEFSDAMIFALVDSSPSRTLSGIVDRMKDANLKSRIEVMAVKEMDLDYFYRFINPSPEAKAIFDVRLSSHIAGLKDADIVRFCRTYEEEARYAVQKGLGGDNAARLRALAKGLVPHLYSALQDWERSQT